VSGQSRQAPANTAGGPAPSQEPARLTGKQRQKLATQRKLLAAAREEFQRYGFSGGRVDRIAEMAGVNKRSIYMYFGDKAGLFDAVIRENRNAVGAAVKFDASDLPAYALRLYEYWQTHPESVRLFWWRNLERESTTDVEEAAYSGMVADIGATQRTGGVDPAIPPAHLFAFVLGLLQSWAVPSDSFSVALDEEEAGRRRASIRTAVERLIADAGQPRP
jgi:AcrR family transcriptional regulator